MPSQRGIAYGATCFIKERSYKLKENSGSSLGKEGSNKKKNKSKGCLFGFLSVLIILVLICSGLAYWQRDNIKAYLYAKTHSSQEIKQEMDENKQVVEKALEDYNVSSLRDFSEEEEKQIQSGELSVDEAVERILAGSNVGSLNTEVQAAEVNEEETQNEPVTSSPTPSSPQTSAPEKVSEEKAKEPVSKGESPQEDPVKDLVAEYAVKMYTLKAEYLGAIGSLVDQAKADKKNGVSKSEILSNYLGRVGSLENAADTEVDKVLSEFKVKLSALGADTSIAELMRSSYEKEKSLKKSYYLSLYEEKSK